MSEFFNYMPILCHDSGVMIELNPSDAIDLATSGTGTAMLARRFQSAKMVQINPLSLKRLSEDPDLLSSLEKIESFRNLSQDVTGITVASDRIDTAKKRAKDSGQKLPDQIKKDDKRNRDHMEDIRDNLLKFIARLPVFMYLNDQRERTALEVIETTDDALFEKVTGISKSIFRKLIELGVFNDAFMNDAIRAFKQVEDNALVYLGDREIKGALVAAWDSHVERAV